MNAPAADALDFGAAFRLFRRPQALTPPMIALFAIMPLYLFIGGGLIPGLKVHAPELELDRALPLVPAWSAVYGSLFCAAFLPAFVVHEPRLLDRTVLAYLLAWLVSYAVFLLYPTVAPHHPDVDPRSFGEWGLKVIYSADVKYNCFPSLHVAQSFVAALACYHINRRVGWVTLAWATLVGVSTLFTKQHYFADVVAGAALGYAAYRVFIRRFPREAIPENHKRLAPVLCAAAFGAYASVWLIFAVLYAFGIRP